MKSYTTTVEQDPDDPESYVITFPDEILDEAGWKVGDTLIWQIDEKNQTVIISKKS